jgi:hypothetical protein
MPTKAGQAQAEAELRRVGGADAMSKSKDTKKEERKTPTKSLKEKRAEKQAKKDRKS